MGRNLGGSSSEGDSAPGPHEPKQNVTSKEEGGGNHWRLQGSTPMLCFWGVVLECFSRTFSKG